MPITTVAPKTNRPKILFKPWKSSTETPPIDDDIEMRIGHFIDPYLLVCFLCQREFDTDKEVEDHQSNSTEHANKVESYRKLATHTEPHRDRAAERRELFPSGDHDVRASEALPSPLESFGAKILKKLGWKVGEGLGPEGQGITQPVMVIRRIFKF